MKYYTIYDNGYFWVKEAKSIRGAGNLVIVENTKHLIRRNELFDTEKDAIKDLGTTEIPCVTIGGYVVVPHDYNGYKDW